MTDTHTATYSAFIDVLDNGDFADSIDDVSARLRADTAISVSRGKDSARPGAPPMAAQGQFELDNQDRALSPENAAGAYYQLLIPDRTARVQTAYGSKVLYDEPDLDYDAPIDYDGLTTKALLTGPIDEPVQNPERLRRSVTINMMGSMARLRGVHITSTTIYFQKRTDEIITIILDLAGWPAADRNLAVGDNTNEWWWALKADAYDALISIFAAEGAGAALYEDGLGVIHFENRNYRLTTARSTGVQATFLDRRIASADVAFQSFRYEPGLKDVYNSVSMLIEQRTADAAFAEGWKYGSALTLGNNETKIIYADFDSTDPLYGHDSLNAGTQYSLTAGSLASKTVHLEDVATIKVTLVAGAGGATIDSAAADGTGFRIDVKYLKSRGRQLISQTVAGSTLISNTRSLELAQAGTWPVLIPNNAQAIVDAAALYWRDPRPTVSIEVVNSNRNTLLAGISREVSDRIRITEPFSGFDRDVWVEQVIHKGEMAGNMSRVGLICSVVLDASAPALWDSGLWDSGLWGL